MEGINSKFKNIKNILKNCVETDDIEEIFLNENI